MIKQFGRAGSGPGELARPAAVAYNDGAIYVLDAGNGRISVFDDGGSYRTQLPVAATGGLGLATGHGRVLQTAAPSSGAYAVGMMGPDSFALRRPQQIVGDHESLGTSKNPMAFDVVVPTAEGYVVLDNYTGALVLYGKNGDFQTVRPLPIEIVANAREYARRVNEGFEGRVLASPLFRDIVQTSDDRLFLLAPSSGVLGYLIDQEAWTARPVEADVPERGTYGSAAMLGTQLYLAGSDGFAIVRFER